MQALNVRTRDLLEATPLPQPPTVPYSSLVLTTSATSFIIHKYLKQDVYHLQNPIFNTQFFLFFSLLQKIAKPPYQLGGKHPERVPYLLSSCVSTGNRQAPVLMDVQTRRGKPSNPVLISTFPARGGRDFYHLLI